MTSKTIEDRAAGAIMGAFIGDALGLGPHWYYDLAELRQHYGDWIDGYTTPKPERYHGGMQAGENSQSGFLLELLTDSLLTNNEYDEKDFCCRLDNDFFPLLDGTSTVGPGGFTSQSMRETWALRAQQNKPWTDVAGHTDNTEAVERTIALAVRYANQPKKLAESISSNTLLTQYDQTIAAMTVAYGAVLGLLIEGQPLDEKISTTLMQRVASQELPFHAMTIASSKPSGAGAFASPDALLTPSGIARAAHEDLIQPAWKVSLVYGMPCAIYHITPAAYYLAAKFANDFEAGVLHAINGGGQNQARAMLTGALIGAQTGLSGIPQHFIEGLKDSEQLLIKAKKLADKLSSHS